MDVEKVAQDRYRLRSHDHIMTVSAQDLLDVMDWVLLRATELRKEAEQSHEDEDTRKYMEHHYLGSADDEGEAEAAERVRRYNQEMDERNRIAHENRDKPWLPGVE